MPAVSGSQQRLMGMVHAYQQGKLKRAPKKIKDVAKHISPEDAKHFAQTSHKGLPERKKKETEKSAAQGKPVIVTVGKKQYRLPSLKDAVVWLASQPGITNAEAQAAIGSRATGIESIRLQYPPA